MRTWARSRAQTTFANLLRTFTCLHTLTQPFQSAHTYIHSTSTHDKCNHEIKLASPALAGNWQHIPHILLPWTSRFAALGRPQDQSPLQAQAGMRQLPFLCAVPPQQSFYSCNLGQKGIGEGALLLL